MKALERLQLIPLRGELDRLCNKVDELRCDTEELLGEVPSVELLNDAVDYIERALDCIEDAIEKPADE